MAEHLGHDLMNAIDASICGHPGHNFTAYSPQDQTHGIAKVSKVKIIRNASSASNTVGAITAVTLALTT